MRGSESDFRSRAAVQHRIRARKGQLAKLGASFLMERTGSRVSVVLAPAFMLVETIVPYVSGDTSSS